MALQSNINFENITNTLGSSINTRESDINAKISDPNFGDNVGDVIKLGYDTSIWAAVVGATQNVVKELGDAMKSVVQKSG